MFLESRLHGNFVSKYVECSGLLIRVSEPNTEGIKHLTLASAAVSTIKGCLNRAVNSRVETRATWPLKASMRASRES